MQEFVALMHKKIADDEHNDDIEEAFKVFDTKNDGYLHSLFIFNKYNIILISHSKGYLRRGADECDGEPRQPPNNGRDKGWRLHCLEFFFRF